MPAHHDIDIDEARRRARRGPRMLLLGRVVLLLVTFLSTVTTARLVSPHEFGLSAMSAVVLTFAQIFRDFGVTNAVLRKGKITPEELTLVFWFNVCSTTFLTLVLVCAAPFVADFYGEPIIFWTMLCSLIGFQVGGIALQHRAIINRALRFGTIALIDITGLLVGFGVTIVLALIRHDVWAIVIGSVSQVIVSAILSLCLSGWRPSRPARSAELRDLVKFGANSTVYALSVLVSNNIAVLLVGRVFGAGMLGQYSRAQNLFALPNTNLIQPIAQATMPLLTRLRGQPEEYRAAYLDLVRRLCVFLMPLSVTLAFIALPLIRLLLGDRWGTAGLVLTALAPALGFIGIAYAAGDVFITQDRARELRNLGLFEAVVRIGAIVIGVQFGLVATAAAYSGSTIVVSIVRAAVAGRSGPVTARDQYGAASVGVLPGLVAGVFCTVAFFLRPDADLAAVIVLTAAGILGAVVGGLLTRSSRAALRELVDIFGLGRLLRRVRPKSSAA